MKGTIIKKTSGKANEEIQKRKKHKVIHRKVNDFPQGFRDKCQAARSWGGKKHRRCFNGGGEDYTYSSLMLRNKIYSPFLGKRRNAMNFYFALYQLIETVEGLGKDIQHLAGRALRISPRDARANRELLEQCESKLHEVRNLLHNKTHISKITLRKAALLFQILEVSYHRVMHLAAATANVSPDDEGSVKS